MRDIVEVMIEQEGFEKSAYISAFETMADGQSTTSDDR
jgi:hypothetical protein